MKSISILILTLSVFLLQVHKSIASDNFRGIDPKLSRIERKLDQIIAKLSNQQNPNTFTITSTVDIDCLSSCISRYCSYYGSERKELLDCITICKSAEVNQENCRISKRTDNEKCIEVAESRIRKSHQNITTDESKRIKIECQTVDLICFF